MILRFTARVLPGRRVQRPEFAPYHLVNGEPVNVSDFRAELWKIHAARPDLRLPAVLDLDRLPPFVDAVSDNGELAVVTVDYAAARHTAPTEQQSTNWSQKTWPINQRKRWLRLQ